MGKIEDILAQCLSELERGASVADCLARYPERQAELEPLLRTVERVSGTPDVAPSLSFRQSARARMVSRIQAQATAESHAEEPERKGLLERLWPHLGIPVTIRRFAVPAVAAITLVLLLGMLGVGAVYASSGSLPGDSLYAVKLAGERVRLALSLGDSNDARLHLRFAGERLEEAAALVERSRVDDIESLMGRYAAQVEAAGMVLQRQRARGQDVTALCARFQEHLARHQMVLNRVRGQVPEEAQFAVDQALATSRKAQNRVLEQPQAPPTSTPTATVTRTGTLTPSPTPSSTETCTPIGTAQPAGKSEPPGKPEPPGQTMTPQPPGLTMTPQPPGQTMTPQPPGLTMTPQPPGLTMTPQPPGLTMTPQPPGRTMTPEPPGRTRTAEPPGPPDDQVPPGAPRVADTPTPGDA